MSTKCLDLLPTYFEGNRIVSNQTRPLQEIQQGRITDVSARSLPLRTNEDTVRPFSATARMKTLMKDSNEYRVAQRSKQIYYGISTVGYRNYLLWCYENNRRINDEELSTVPNPELEWPKRVWDNEVATWRRKLHQYDDLYSNDCHTAPGFDAVMHKLESDRDTIKIFIERTRLKKCLAELETAELSEKQLVDSLEQRSPSSRIDHEQFWAAEPVVKLPISLLEQRIAKDE